MTQVSDRILIDAHIKGDREAFDEIVRRYGPALLGYLHKMVRNTEHAEDIFQETFKRVHQKADTLRGSNFKSWMYRIATNIAMDTIRSNKRRHTIRLNVESHCHDGHCDALAETVAGDEDCNPVKQLVKAEQKELVLKSLDKLPYKQRAALTLAYYQQMSYKEVAGILDCSVGTVKRHMFRALRTLARTLPNLAGEIE